MIKKIWIVLLFSTIALCGCRNNSESQPGNGNENTEPVEQENIGDGSTIIKAPDFTLKDINGNDVKLSSYKGKIVILDFWATWCPPCRKGIPDLIDLQNRYSDDLVVIGVSLDQSNTINEVVPFYNSYKMNYPVVYGNGMVVQQYGGIEAIPTSFIIDKKGNIINRYVGLIPKEEYENQIRNLN